MCNSASLTQKQKKLEDHYAAQMQVPLLYKPYYHRAAYDFPNLFIIPQEDTEHIHPASWGFIPEHIESNPYFAEIHNRRRRMPLVLDESLEWEWLNNFNSDKPIEELIRHGFTKDEFSDHPVSDDLYKKGIDTDRPYIIDPVEPPLSLF